MSSAASQAGCQQSGRILTHLSIRTFNYVP
jgi:hypothetical protein